MISHRTRRFRALYDALPERIRHDTDTAYAQFAADPNHPSLNFERLQGIKPPLFSARINEQYRVLGRGEGADTIVWFWIGSHQDYDKLLSQHRKGRR